MAHFGAVPIDYRAEDFVDVLRRELPGGIDAVFDPIGGQNWQGSFETLSRTGRFVGYGYTSVLNGGEPSEWLREWATFAQRGTSERGNPVRMYSVTALRQERPNWFSEDLQQIFALLREGRIHPLVSHRIPLRDAAYAHEVLNDPRHVGKIVLTVD